MTIPPLQKLLASESSRVEWKESDRDSKKFLPAISALANDLEGSGEAGFLVLGVEDKLGTVKGLPYATRKERDEAQQQLENRIAGVSLAPQPSVSIHAFAHGEAWLIVVEIAPYPTPPPVRYDAYVRRGTVTRKANEADVARLLERRPEGQLPYDQRRVAGATIADLDLTALRLEHAAKAEGDDTFPLLEAWLVQRGIVRRSGDGFVPTVMGLLLHGLEPTTFIKGASIEMVKYEGVDEDSRILARKTILGALPRQLDLAWDVVDAWNVDVPLPPNRIQLSFGRQYPPDALKELVRNLVQHRTYEGTHAPARITWFSDRIEISNPGGPFGVANQAEFGAQSDYRNPGLTERLAELGYVQKLGRGVRLVRKFLSQNGHPPLEVQTDGFTTLTIRGRS